MKITTLSKRVLVVALTLFAISLLGFAVLSKTLRQKPRKENHPTYDAATVTVAPEVVSKIKGLEISGVTLINQGRPDAALAIDVTNNRDEAVMVLDFVAGGDQLASGLGIDGLLEEGQAQIIIPPHTLKTFTWFVSEIIEGHTVFLAAAVFSDGKEEGDKRSLDGLRIQRQHFQQRQRDAKTKNGGQ